MAIRTYNFGAEMVRVLGLPKQTQWLELRVAVNEVVSVKAGIYPKFDGEELVELLTEYELVEKEKL